MNKYLKGVHVCCELSTWQSQAHELEIIETLDTENGQPITSRDLQVKHSG